ncbi:hypothetical protein ACHAWO_010201 [Cyclotella atomus]|uniref:Uncharacterized protein n=1 Tax=Cyclotella atomus TaxID=382360 RepID=A0ABD3PH66_9STRA
MSSLPAAPALEAAASLASITVRYACSSSRSVNPTNPNNEVVCGAGSFRKMRGCTLSVLMKHLCAECGKSTHGFQCACHIPTDRQGDNRDGVVVNEYYFSQKGPGRLSPLAMLQCYASHVTRKHTEMALISTLLRLLSTDWVNLAAPTASSKKKAVPDPDLLKNLYNLDELEAMSKEHNNILDLLVNHCGGTDEAVSRIRRVKAQVEKKNNLDKFCYDYDAEADL